MMTRILETALPLVLILLFAACTSSGPQKLDPIPLTDEEIAFLQKLNDPEATSLVQEVPELFHGLSNLLSAWWDSALAKDSPKDIRIYTSLGDLLTRRVYFNFETILNQLDNGPPPNRVIAAAALGFSRIPENDHYPQIHPRAIEALIEVLDCGNDSIVENALLSLYVLGDPNTPLEPVLDIMTQHHAPNVRANAALAVQAIATPEKSDIILPYVLPGLKDDEPKVRNHSILIATKLRHPSTIEPLLELLMDPYPLIRANSAQALGEVADIRICGELIPLLASAYPIERECALKSLRKLSGEEYGFEAEDWQSWWDDYTTD